MNSELDVTHNGWKSQKSLILQHRSRCSLLKSEFFRAKNLHEKNLIFFGKWDILRYFQTQCFMRRIIFSKNLFLRVCSLLSTKLQTLSNWKSAHAFCKVCLHIILRSLYFYPFTHLVKCHINNESWVDEKWNMVARMSIIFPFSKCSKFN